MVPKELKIKIYVIYLVNHKMAWSIEQAKNSKHPMRIIVTTDSEKYARIARNYGAETPFLRPSEISQDLSTDLEFIQHVFRRIEKRRLYTRFYSSIASYLSD